MEQRADAAEKEIERREARQAQCEADCRELEALCDELRELSPLISVQHEFAANQVSVAIAVLQFRPGVRARISFQSSISLHRTRSDVRAVNRPGENESHSFFRLPDLRGHLEKHLMAEIAKEISSLGIGSIEIYNNGHEAGRQWAAHCEPQERRRLWKNRRGSDGLGFGVCVRGVLPADGR
jgi:hypothetical protein